MRFLQAWTLLSVFVFHLLLEVNSRKWIAASACNRANLALYKVFKAKAGSAKTNLPPTEAVAVPG